MIAARTHHSLRPLMYAGGFLLAALGVAAAWRFTPLAHYAEPKAIGQLIRSLRHSPWLIPSIVAAYVLASSTLFPNTVLNAATILALGTTQGPPLALGGSLVAATLFYVAGRGPARKHIRELDSARLEKLNAMLRKGGIVGMATLRLLPIAPFSVVNLMSGAAKVKPTAFIVGTFLGLLPGCLMVTAFGHQLRRMLSSPGPVEIATLVGVGVLALLVLWGLQKMLSSRP